MVESTRPIVETSADGVFGGVPYSYALEDRCISGPYSESDAGPLAAEILAVQRSDALPVYESLAGLGADEFTVASSAVPGFRVFSGIPYPGPFGSLIIVTAMHHPDECLRFTEFLISVTPPDAIEFDGVNDWPAVAGIDAVDALRRLRTECMAMSREEAMQTFGEFGFRAPNGEIVEATTVAEACVAATQARSYALRITSPIGAVIVSNVFGQIFVEEIH